MLTEHAVSYSEKLTMKELDYLIKKANRLGKNGRDVTRVYQEEDGEGHHVYFEVTGLVRRNECTPRNKMLSMNTTAEFGG